MYPGHCLIGKLQLIYPDGWGSHQEKGGILNQSEIKKCLTNITVSFIINEYAAQ